MNYKTPSLLLLVTLIITLFSSCDNELDITADYKDVTVVYGFLNPNDTTHYIKIYKGFLTDENALVQAAYLDNITYYDSIDVVLEEYINDHLNRTIVLDTTTAIDKEEGETAYPEQVLYYTTETLNQAAQYKLLITHKGTGKVTTAETNLVNDFRITSPRFNYLDLNLTSINKIKFSKPENGTAYDIYWRFKYVEVSKATNEIVKYGVVSKKLNSSFVRNSAATSDGTINFDYVPKDLFNIIASQIKVDNSVIRYPAEYNCMEILVWAGEENLITYVDLATPSSSIVQDRVEFSNVSSEDGSSLGIFSSRNSAIKHLCLETINHCEDTLVSGSVTGHLGFDYFRNFNDENQ